MATSKKKLAAKSANKAAVKKAAKPAPKPVAKAAPKPAAKPVMQAAKPMVRPLNVANKPAQLPMPAMANGGVNKMPGGCGCGGNCGCGAQTICGCLLLGLYARGKTWMNVFVATLVFFGFDWMWHGQVMHDAYAASESLWRPMAEMRMDLCFFMHLLTGFVFGGLFTLLGTKGVINGARAGLLLGLMWVPATIAAYNFQPLPLEVAQMWALGSVLSGVVAGVVLALVSKCCGGCCSNGTCK